MPDNDKPLTPIDKLLAGLTAMASKLDTIATRVDEIEAARAAPPAPPAAPPPAPPAADNDMPIKAKVDDTDPDEKGDLPPGEVPGAPAPAAADSSLQAIRTRRAKLAAFQARADAVCGLFGSSAPRPLEGESVNGYARRILRGWAPMSESWKGIDLDTLNGATLAIAADDIMRSAADEAANPKVPSGFLMERKRSDGGHTVTEFFGQSRLWLEQAGARPRRYVTRINLNPHQRLLGALMPAPQAVKMRQYGYPPPAGSRIYLPAGSSPPVVVVASKAPALIWSTTQLSSVLLSHGTERDRVA